MSEAITITLPGKNDPLGDRWASRVAALYDQALVELSIPKVGPGMGAVWSLYQYQYCQMADMPSRVVSSPQAMAMCGWNITDEMIATAERILRHTGTILERQKAAQQPVMHDFTATPGPISYAPSENYGRDALA